MRLEVAVIADIPAITRVHRLRIDAPVVGHVARAQRERIAVEGVAPFREQRLLGARVGAVLVEIEVEPAADGARDRRAGHRIHDREDLVRVVLVAVHLAVGQGDLEQRAAREHLRDAEQQVVDVLRVAAAAGLDDAAFVIVTGNGGQHRRKGERHAAHRVDGVLRDRAAQEESGVLQVEVALEAAVDAEVQVVVLLRGGEAGVPAHGIAERLLPVPRQRDARVEEGVVERRVAGGDVVGRAARGAGEGLHGVCGHGAGGCGARERVHGEVQVEGAVLVQHAADRGHEARVHHAVVVLAVEEKRRVHFPVRLLGERCANRFLQLHPQPPPAKPRPPLDASLLK